MPELSLCALNTYSLPRPVSPSAPRLHGSALRAGEYALARNTTLRVVCRKESIVVFAFGELGIPAGSTSLASQMIEARSERIPFETALKEKPKPPMAISAFLPRPVSNQGPSG